MVQLLKLIIKLTITIFFTPEVHKMKNSPLFLCFKIKITKEKENEEE